ncbi:response regulator transcription factor [Fulvivirga lutea]|uniref:Phosphate regulon transcriptional regulatory protein PhoB n=1 Tax=Fulvivirga lutea TaxID=2810512 RepID=A0A974WI16_9BACT|nr:response regulator transcription factor [Fulvivirga lutea]QSE98269.1 response regulator transcription factor [Fulvivirga lutea]
MKRVLLIEDDLHIKELLEIHLKDLGCELTMAMDGKVGYTLATKEQFDLIILDIMLPNKDGLEICRDLRAHQILTPILMLTARSEEIDKIMGLETGADDYLTKPFSVREFIARVKAIFRRMEMSKGDKEDKALLKIGELIIDHAKRKVVDGEERIELTPKEFDLLYLLASNPGKSYSRDRLLTLVWGYEFEGYEHTVNSHINRLRAKVEKNLSNPQYILTTWGVGYRFNDELEITKNLAS